MEWIKYSLVYTADSVRKFDSKSNRTADSIRDSIRTQKKRFAGPYYKLCYYVSDLTKLPQCFRWDVVLRHSVCQ